MVVPPEKVPILADFPGSDTEHLRPVIDYLKAQGYTPATGDVFQFNRDGLGTYGFVELLDTAGLQERFDFPPSVQVTPTSVYDTRHFVRIRQDSGSQPVRRLSFER